MSRPVSCRRDAQRSTDSASGSSKPQSDSTCSSSPTAVGLLEQVESDWGLEDPLAESVLRWASRLHETGLDIAHSKYQRHSAYLLEHADMPGFPREEQLLL